MIIYLKTISTTYIDTIITKDLSERRVIMSNITTFARDLEFTNQGFELYNESDIRGFLYKDIVYYQNIVASIENKINL